MLNRNSPAIVPDHTQVLAGSIPERGRSQCEPKRVAAGGYQLANTPCSRFSLKGITGWHIHRDVTMSNKGLKDLVQMGHVLLL